MDMQQPLTLQDLCVCFVSVHLDIVESLVNFPDTIGQKIFAWAVKEGRFRLGGAYSESTVSGRLRTFCDAYEDALLSSMCLSSEHLFLNGHFETLSLFKHLTKLDVSNCGLGDGHELLHHASTLKRLQTLNLAGNALSDTGVRRLTTPCRILQTGALQLLHLDLSDNLLTSSCLKFLTVFHQLQLLCVQFDVQKGGEFEQFLKRQGWKVATEDPDISLVFKCQTQGWARDVLEDWKSSLQQRQLASVPGNSFYKKRRLAEKPGFSWGGHGGRRLALQRHLGKELVGPMPSLNTASQPRLMEQCRATENPLHVATSHRILSVATSSSTVGDVPTRGVTSCAKNFPSAGIKKGGNSAVLEAELESDEDRDLLAMYGASSSQGNSIAGSSSSALNLFW